MLTAENHTSRHTAIILLFQSLTKVEMGCPLVFSEACTQTLSPGRSRQSLRRLILMGKDSRRAPLGVFTLVDLPHLQPPIQIH